MTKVDEYMTKKIAAGKNNGCTLEKAGVRREWYVNSNLASLPRCSKFRQGRHDRRAEARFR